MRKVDGGLQALATWVDQSRDGKFLIGDSLTLADIAVGSVLGWMSLRWPDHPWAGKHPQLKAYYDALGTRESFKTTRPAPQTITDKVV